MPLRVTFLSDSMLKFVESVFIDLGYDSYERVVAIRGSKIEIVSELASENCKDSDLLVIKSGINNIMDGYSVSNCMYLYKKSFYSIQECCPNADIAFVDVSYVAENVYTGTAVSGDINPMISSLNAALEKFCAQNDKAHFIDLRHYLSSNGMNTIDRCNLGSDGLHYSSRGNHVVANSLIREVERLKQNLKRCDLMSDLTSPVSLELTTSNKDANWPALPEPAVKTNIKPIASYPGQQYITVNVDSRKKTPVLNHDRKLSQVVPCSNRIDKKPAQRQIFKKQHTLSTVKCQTGNKCIKRSTSFSQTYSRKKRNEENGCIALTNRFSVLCNEKLPYHSAEIELDDRLNDTHSKCKATGIPRVSTKKNFKKSNVHIRLQFPVQMLQTQLWKGARKSVRALCLQIHIACRYSIRSCIPSLLSFWMRKVVTPALIKIQKGCSSSLK